MPAFLTCSLVFCAYLMSIQALFSSGYVRVSQRRLAALLAPVAGMILAAAALCSISLGSWDDMLMLMTVLIPIAAIVISVRTICSERNDLNIYLIILFVLYLFAVGFVTLFSRDGTTSTKVLFGLFKIEKAIKTGSARPLMHILQNILLFMPFGLLLGACCKRRSGTLVTVLTYALIFSCIIESFQYLLVIGECDLEDVLSNTLGAWAGLGIYRLYLRTQ